MFTVVCVCDRMRMYVKRIFCIKIHCLTKTHTFDTYRKTATTCTVKYCPVDGWYFTVYSRNGAVLISFTVVKGIANIVVLLELGGQAGEV
jgi:hypothetical protein